MSGMATITVLGTLGADAEQREAGGSSLVSWRMAVNTRQGQQEVTDWYTCTMWGARGEKLRQHLTKGKMVAVSGGFHTRQYDAKNGEQRTSLEIRVDGFAFAGGKREEGGGGRDYSPPSGGGGGGFGDDSIPFSRYDGRTA